MEVVRDGMVLIGPSQKVGLVWVLNPAALTHNMRFTLLDQQAVLVLVVGNLACVSL